MTTLFRSWRRERRYRAALGELSRMPRQELERLGIPRREIVRLAKAASQI